MAKASFTKSGNVKLVVDEVQFIAIVKLLLQVDTSNTDHVSSLLSDIDDFILDNNFEFAIDDVEFNVHFINDSKNISLELV